MTGCTSSPSAATSDQTHEWFTVSPWLTTHSQSVWNWSLLREIGERAVSPIPCAKMRALNRPVAQLVRAGRPGRPGLRFEPARAYRVPFPLAMAAVVYILQSETA